MEIRKLWKKGLSLLMVAAMVLVLATATGCGDSGKEDQTQKDTSGNVDESSGNDTVESNENSQAKGRYMENEIPMPEEFSRTYDMRSLADGTIGLLDMARGFYVSEDSGQTWKLKDDSFLQKLGDAYVMRASLGSDGSIFACYVVSTEDTEASEEEEESTDTLIQYKYCLIGADGTFTEVNLKSDALKEKSLTSITILADKTILLSFDNTAYELNTETGELSARYETQNRIVQIKEIGKYLYLATQDGVQCMNLENGEEIQDETLSNYVKETLAGRDAFASEGSYIFMICEGDTEDAVCIASSKGLYRHVIGGTVMEEVIKGELSSLSDPSLELQGLVNLPDGSFLIAYTGQLLKHYTYDSEVSAVPEHKLKVYSLEEDQGIRMAIVDYQKSHSDTYVAYEVGMTGTDGVTREDAIRNLNTAILSGEGPDVLVLDGLPVNSYMEKGILEDLSPLFENQLKEQDYFENIVDVYKKDGAYMALPARFCFPIIMGDTQVVDRITDLSSFADTMKALRTEQESGSLIGAYTEEGVLRLLYEVCAPAWVEQDGTIKKEGLVTFLSKAKEIYEAESKGISQEELADKLETTERIKKYFAEGGQLELSWSKLFLNPQMRSNEYMSEKNQMVVGFSSGIKMDYSMLTSIGDQMANEQKIKAFDGLSNGVFLPNTILGVNSQGSGKEPAMDFVAFLLAKENQSKDSETGYPVQKASFDTFMEDTYYSPENEDSTMFGVSWSTPDGQMGSMDVKWPNAEHLENLKKMVEGLTTASITDYNLKDTVLKLAPDALNGTKDVESVANEIINKMQIYLSE